MRIALVYLAAAAPLALIAMPAQAQGFETTAAATIGSGDYESAERILKQQLRNRPDTPELLLNLAAVYVHTGRPAEARALYEQVLAQREIALERMTKGEAGSHTIARTGLRRIETAQKSPR